MIIDDMKNLKDLISLLESKDSVEAGYSVLEQIYKGAATRRPPKVMNPDPNIEYGGEILKMFGEGGKLNFYFKYEKDVSLKTEQVESIHIGFDVCDIYSSLENKRKNGRFSFQYDDMRMPRNKPNYRRILFFYADSTNPKRIADYFLGANKIDFKDKGFYILSQKNENGNPSGLAFIFDYKFGRYYFANFNDGELEGFAFKFTASSDSYVFEDAYVFHQGKKTSLYADVVNSIKENGELKVISWS